MIIMPDPGCAGPKATSCLLPVASGAFLFRSH
jgi:hypothetical protein